ncbi:MAG: AAA family ATPase [bacterium]
MKTILIYGAPGVGKLTVAQELSKITGYKILHNHLINDLVSIAREFGTPEFWKIAHKYRIELMNESAINKKSGIILTFVYAKNTDDPMLKKIVTQARKHGGEMIFVHLVCDKGELFKRVKSPSRKMFKKIKTQKKVTEIMKKHDLFGDVPYEPNFVIDNTKISPAKTARLIKNTFNLQNNS